MFCTQSWQSASVKDSNKFWFHQSQALSRRILNSINEWRSPGVLLTVTWPSSDHLTFIWPSSDLQLVSTPMSDPAGLYCAVLCCTRAIYCTVHNEQSCFYSMFFFKVSYFEGSFSFTSWPHTKCISPPWCVEPWSEVGLGFWMRPIDIVWSRNQDRAVSRGRNVPSSAATRSSFQLERGER